MTQERPAMARRGDPKYTWDDTVAAIGRDFSGGRVHVGQEKIDPSSVSRYCEVWEYGNLIYWDRRVAKGAGYKNVVVPWSSTYQTFTYDSFWRPGQPSRFSPGTDKNAMTANVAPREEADEQVPMPPTTQGIITDIQIEFFEPLCIGDRLTAKGSKLVNVRVRETRIGYGAFMNRESEFYNQRGELVARINRGGFSYNAGAKAPQQSGSARRS